jgi:hypothetical protein
LQKTKNEMEKKEFIQIGLSDGNWAVISIGSIVAVEQLQGGIFRIYMDAKKPDGTSVYFDQPGSVGGFWASYLRLPTTQTLGSIPCN